MANNNDAFTAMLLPQMMAQTQAMQQMAMRPQKSYATTTTTSTSTPYALADMIARRDSIGNASRALEDALKKREDLGYVLASSLGAIPQQQGYGSWLTDFARSLGGGMATPTNLEVDRAQKKYEADMADLQQALAFDKAMGETQTQKRTENIGYTEMPYGTQQKGMTDERRKQIQNTLITGENLGDLFQTINAYPQTFSTVGGIKQDEASRGLRSGITTEGVTEMGHREFEYLQSIMPNGFATTINSASEQKTMRPYTTTFENGTGSAKKAVIKNMLGGIYDEFARDARAQGYQMPITKEEYINARINAGRVRNPDYYVGKSDRMYIEAPMAIPAAQRISDEDFINQLNGIQGLK